MDAEAVNIGEGTATENTGSEAIEDQGENSTENAINQGVLDVYKNTETGETAGQADDQAEAETGEGEPEQDLKFQIDPDLMDDKTIQRFIKDGVLDVNSMAKSLVEKEKMLRSPVPEAYEVEDVMAQYDLSWDSDEQRDGFVKGAKEHKISQEAMKWLLEEYGQRMTAFTQAVGPLLQTDVNEEFDAVRGEWGSEAKQRFDALIAFAEARPEVHNMFNLRHRDGVKAAYDFYVSQRGPELVDAVAAGSVEDLESDMRAIMDEKDYWTSPAKQKKAADIAQKIALRQKR